MTSKLEMMKDVVQVAVESGAERVGRIVGLITGTVKGVAHEVGEWASDVFEVIEAANRKHPKPAPGQGKPGEDEG